MTCVLVLGCGHSITLTGSLSETLTRVGRKVYCAECRENRTLVEYAEWSDR